MLNGAEWKAIRCLATSTEADCTPLPTSSPGLHHQLLENAATIEALLDSLSGSKVGDGLNGSVLAAVHHLWIEQPIVPSSEDLSRRIETAGMNNYVSSRRRNRDLRLEHQRRIRAANAARNPSL